ncbi:hypothetical protein MBH78_05805 [Oceanimonas sp. NS1]|nr:hypothetical protein [Oceanimonas sp. NS1]
MLIQGLKAFKLAGKAAVAGGVHHQQRLAGKLAHIEKFAGMQPGQLVLIKGGGIGLGGGGCVTQQQAAQATEQFLHSTLLSGISTDMA